MNGPIKRPCYSPKQVAAILGVSVDLARNDERIPWHFVGRNRSHRKVAHAALVDFLLRYDYDVPLDWLPSKKIPKDGIPVDAVVMWKAHGFWYCSRYLKPQTTALALTMADAVKQLEEQEVQNATSDIA